MMQRQRSASVALGLVATALVAALVAVACQDATTPTATANRPHFWSGGQCTTGKWTGGGRIDPPNKPDAADAATGSEFLAEPLDPMTGKVTFGFNVFLGSDGAGNCVVTKGEIEVNGHNIVYHGQSFKIAWHVSIHDGVDAFGTHVRASTFAPDASGRGACLVVGLPSSDVSIDYMVARVNPGQGSERVQFEVCDNDRGAPQNSRTDAMRWRTHDHGDTFLMYLTGGNVVEHSS